MPELPEVETVRRGLHRARLLAPIREVWRSRYPLRIGAQWREENLGLLEGTGPRAVSRRGKFLVWAFEPLAGGRNIGLLVHLGMTGRLVIETPSTPRAPHTHLVLTLEDDREIRFVDPRRFGGLRTAEWTTLLATEPLSSLGPEPLSRSFSAEILERAGGRSRRAIRDVLLDQRVVAGLGNIYVLEALYRARIHPLVAARWLRPSAWSRLHDAIADVLREGIRNGGTTFRDYRGARGQRGRNQDNLRVYGRAGQPCRACGAVLAPFVLGGRSGVYCPTEQGRSGGRWVR